MAGETLDPRMMRVQPRLRYNTVGGINGPLVILENVSPASPVLDNMDMSLLVPGHQHAHLSYTSRAAHGGHGATTARAMKGTSADMDVTSGQIPPIQ